MKFISWNVNGLRACVQEEVQKIAEQYREKEEKPVIP